VTTAIVLIKTETDQVSALAQKINEVRGVSEVFSVAGQYDLVAIVRVSSNERLAEVVSDDIRRLPGIKYSETLIAFRVYTREEIEGVFSLGGRN
jgi:DNA-binding Lrp family transcriptional regulator